LISLIYIATPPTSLGGLQTLTEVTAGAIAILAAGATFLLVRTEQRFAFRLLKLYRAGLAEKKVKEKEVAKAKSLVKAFSKMTDSLLLALLYLSISLFSSILTFFSEIKLIGSVSIATFLVGFVYVIWFIWLVIKQMREMHEVLAELIKMN
jgi:hypothetical protein